MSRIVIFGNSGSGKSTLASAYQVKRGFAHLDLDVLAWQDTVPPVRKRLAESIEEMDVFLNKNSSWVIEGCYADLLTHALKKADELIFLNPGVETCISNARKRPWEAHKYNSIETQNENLDMLITWIQQYADREDEFSLIAHKRLFTEFTRSKKEIIKNTDLTIW